MKVYFWLGLDSGTEIRIHNRCQVPAKNKLSKASQIPNYNVSLYLYIECLLDILSETIILFILSHHSSLLTQFLILYLIMGEVLLLRAAYTLYQSSSTVDKVNAAIEAVRVFDTDSDLELSDTEIKNALNILKTHISTMADKREAAKLAEMRCMLTFIAISQHMWARNPAKYDDQFSQSAPKLFGMISLTSWDPDPRKAKLAKIICTFYKANGADKLRKKIQKAIDEHEDGSDLHEDGFSDISGDIVDETFGEGGAEILELFL